MQTPELKILAAVAAHGGQPISLAELGRPEHATELISGLVAQGLLRETHSGEKYEITEDGRLRVAGPLDVTLYSRPGCHLCDEAKSQIAPLLEEFHARLTEINIDQDPILRERYDYDVPVILIGSRKAAKHKVDLVQFRRQLRDASLAELQK